MSNYGYIKTAVASPVLRVANPEFNVEEIIKLVKKAEERKAAVIIFPELCITGYTCADLFNQKFLLDKALESVKKLMASTKNMNILAFVGIPIFINDGLYNCAAAIQNGKLIGIIPKMTIPNYKEFYEKRWFTSGVEISKRINEISIIGQTVPFGNLIFKSDEPEFTIGVEICEDVWTTIPPSSIMALNGVDVVGNLSASNEVVAKSEYRRQLIRQQSARCICAYLYSSAGVYESSTDLVFSGDSFICENGALLQKANRFSRSSEIVYADIDIERMGAERRQNKSFKDNHEYLGRHVDYRVVKINYEKDFYNVKEENFDRKIDKNPFVPNDPTSKNERCEEIFNIQVAGLCKRLEHTGMKKAVIAISGGLDSTLALLVTKRAFDVLDLPPENLIGITMPGFGTTDRTYYNALDLMKGLNVNIKEIDIKEACLLHFDEIDHDKNVHDVTYENTQARERTQILMDYANKIGGLVIGTGDLSELALGWCTYNGDHMSMYAVNTSVPKTLVQHLIRWYMEMEFGSCVKDTLSEILDTPISPELLPPDKNGQIKQKTEDVVGPYELHDFFLYNFIRYGTEPSKMMFLAEIAFKNIYTRNEIKKWIEVFHRRFFSQQFKRSCLPDGPKVGSVSLSPRGDWRMPSDADASIWMREIEKL